MYEYGRGDFTQPAGCKTSRGVPFGTAIAEIMTSAPSGSSAPTVVRAGCFSAKNSR